jgi:four helix bundle protein
MINFKNLSVWRASMAFTANLYLNINEITKDEKYGLSMQMKRASVSICSNIAEGTSRKTKKDISRFFVIALGSSFELETQLILTKELDLIDSEIVNFRLKELNHIQGMLNKYNQKLLDNFVE